MAAAAHGERQYFFPSHFGNDARSLSIPPRGPNPMPRPGRRRRRTVSRLIERRRPPLRQSLQPQTARKLQLAGSTDKSGRPTRSAHRSARPDELYTNLVTHTIEHNRTIAIARTAQYPTTRAPTCEIGNVCAQEAQLIHAPPFSISTLSQPLHIQHHCTLRHSSYIGQMLSRTNKQRWITATATNNRLSDAPSH
jgi:hypothetical protein